VGAGLEQREMRVILRQHPPASAGRLPRNCSTTDDPLSFTAPNLSYLLDSPVEFGPLEVRSFTVPACGADRSHVIRVALHEDRPSGLVDTLTTTVGRIVGEQRAIMGELPTFEPGHYTFLIDTLPWARSDGMEHRNSTVITTPATGSGAPPTVVPTMAHELFHAWNVERIRPRSLEPFSFEGPNPSRELWLAEGVTSYIETLTEVRAGTIGLDQALSVVELGREPRRGRTRPPVPLARRDESACAVRRRREVERPQAMRRHVPLVLHVRTRHRPGPRPGASRPE